MISPLRMHDKNAVFCYVAHSTHWQFCNLNFWDPRASNVSHTVVLRPLNAGYFNFTSATVSYLAQEGGQVVVSSTYLMWCIPWDRTYLLMRLYRLRPLSTQPIRVSHRVWGKTNWSVNDVFQQRSVYGISTLNRIGSPSQCGPICLLWWRFRWTSVTSLL